MISRGAVKRGIFALGLVLAVVGYSIDHADRIPGVTEVLAPKYSAAMHTYESMLRDKNTISPSNPGFYEISTLLSRQIYGAGDLTIASIKTTDTGWGVFSVNNIAEQTLWIDAQINFRDGRSYAGRFRDLREEMKQTFLEDTLFHWGVLIFCVGVALSLLAFYWETTEPKNGADSQSTMRTHDPR